MEKPQTFREYLREGTLAHCRKLWAAGMETEALEIGAEFEIKKEEICYNSPQSLCCIAWLAA